MSMETLDNIFLAYFLTQLEVPPPAEGPGSRQADSAPGSSSINNLAGLPNSTLWGNANEIRSTVVSWFERLPRPSKEAEAEAEAKAGVDVDAAACVQSAIGHDLYTRLQTDVATYEAALACKNAARRAAHATAANHRKRLVLERLHRLNATLAQEGEGEGQGEGQGDNAEGRTAASAAVARPVILASGSVSSSSGSSVDDGYGALQGMPLRTDPTCGPALLHAAVRTDQGLVVLARGLARLCLEQVHGQGQGQGQGHGGDTSDTNECLSCAVLLESLSERVRVAAAAAADGAAPSPVPVPAPVGPLDAAIAGLLSVCTLDCSSSSLETYLHKCRGDGDAAAAADLEKGGGGGDDMYNDTAAMSRSRSADGHGDGSRRERWVQRSLSAGRVLFTVRSGLSDATLSRIYANLARIPGVVASSSSSSSSSSSLPGTVEQKKGKDGKDEVFYIFASAPAPAPEAEAEAARSNTARARGGSASRQRQRHNRDGSEDSFSLRVRNTLRMCPIL